MDSTKRGRVYIVGAGPGDPRLITCKGAECLHIADAVLYDELLDRRLLDLTPAPCERIYVGKRGGRKSHSQEEINEILVAHALKGQTVVRLKGGDPLIFGRGGEEALRLNEQKIPFEIVPGISAASGASAYAGIPLTHRGLSSAAVLVTGNEDPEKADSSINWDHLAGLDATLVIFMAARKLDAICQLLIDKGRAANTPAAIVEWGTWPTQRTVTADLEHLPQRATEAGIGSPALLIIGSVVALRPQLNWRESQPLFGRQILITRSKEQTSPLQAGLEDRGATVYSLPLLEIAPPDDWGPLDTAIADLSPYQWAVFTSPNSVRFFFQRLHHHQKDARALYTCRVAAVGTTTAQHLQEYGIRADLLPDEQSQQGLATAFATMDVSGARILFPASSIGRPQLAETLRQRGAEVDHIAAYQNCAPARDALDLPPALLENKVDMVVFASPSSVEHLGQALGQEQTARLFSHAHIASIGPTTADAVRQSGQRVDVQPATSRIDALVEAIASFYGQQSS